MTAQIYYTQFVTIQSGYLNVSILGSGCDTVGTVVAFITRGPGSNPAISKFVCRILNSILCTLSQLSVK